MLYHPSLFASLSPMTSPDSNLQADDNSNVLLSPTLCTARRNAKYIALFFGVESQTSSAPANVNVELKLLLTESSAKELYSLVRKHIFK
jgi:hypothetical protein